MLKRILPLAGIVVLAALTIVVIGNRQQAVPGVPTAPAPSIERGDTLGGAGSPQSTQPDIQVRVGSQYPQGLSSPPTADQGQSKLWFHDGTWWGLLIDASSGTFRLHRLDWDSQTWTDTGLLIDERSNARPDALWDGDHLYVASAGPAATEEDRVHVMRYSYDPAVGGYSLDPGFPVLLTDIGVRRLTIARDTAGVAWISYIQDGQIWLTHTLETDDSWSTPFPLPVEGPTVSADASATVAYGGRIGVVWSDQAVGAINFTSHVDGEPPEAWSTTNAVLEGAKLADDHISARTLEGPQGPTLFVVVKTSLDVLPHDDANAAQMLLLELRPDGSWWRHVYGRLDDSHTRPLLLIDEERRELYIFAVSPFGSGSVYYKRTSADEIDLRPGKGAPLLQVSEHPEITSPTSTKQNLDAASGLVVLAADEATTSYVHGAVTLDEQPAP